MILLLYIYVRCVVRRCSFSCLPRPIFYNARVHFTYICCFFFNQIMRKHFSFRSIYVPYGFGDRHFGRDEILLECCRSLFFVLFHSTRWAKMMRKGIQEKKINRRNQLESSDIYLNQSHHIRWRYIFAFKIGLPCKMKHTQNVYL